MRLDTLAAQLLSRQTDPHAVAPAGENEEPLTVPDFLRVLALSPNGGVLSKEAANVLEMLMQ